MSRVTTSPDESLPELFDDAWKRLQRGASGRRDAFHTFMLANVDRNGRPSARTVVLRSVDSTRSALTFHTDRRSPKVEQLRERPQVTALFYDPAGKCQLRIDGEATLHETDDIADDHWQASHEMSRACYAHRVGPSTEIESPDLGQPLKDGRANFVVVKLRIKTIEVLHLRSEGHRRAIFRRPGEVQDPSGSGWAMSFLAP